MSDSRKLIRNYRWQSTACDHVDNDVGILELTRNQECAELETQLRAHVPLRRSLADELEEAEAEEQKQKEEAAAAEKSAEEAKAAKEAQVKKAAEELALGEAAGEKAQAREM